MNSREVREMGEAWGAAATEVVTEPEATRKPPAATSGGLTSTQVTTNLIADLLEAERQLRWLVEADSRELRAALRMAAYTFAGKAFEVEIQKSQTAVEKWKGDDWMAFFQRVAPVSRGWHDPAVLGERLRAVTGERDDAMVEIARLREEVALRAELAMTGVTQTTAAHRPEIPDRPPVRYARLFSNWARQGLALALVASGISLRLEAAWLVGKRLNVKGTSGSIKGIFDEYLLKRDLLEREVISVGRVRVANVWLTDLGRKVCAASRIPIRETELERVLRLHGGEQQKAHAAAVTVFAYHARRRGHRTEVIPEVEGPAEPDVLIVKDGEKVYVEVEAGRDREAKWRNVADLQGFVAVCAVKQAGQDALVKEIKALGIPGRATHIERLAKDKTYQVSLWAEEWA